MHSLSSAIRPQACVFCSFARSIQRPASRQHKATPILTYSTRSSPKVRVKDSNTRPPKAKIVETQTRDSASLEESRHAKAFPGLVSFKLGDANRSQLRPPGVRTIFSADERIIRQLPQIKRMLESDAVFTQLDLTSAQLKEQYDLFSAEVAGELSKSSPGELGTKLRRLARGGDHRVQLDLKYDLFARCLRVASPDSENILNNHRTFVNLRHPSEWFPRAREFKREWHLHVGPTNSGKTYHALKRLEEATSGIYCGPLRLLAHEVYLRLNAKGKACDLVTGDERRAADTEKASGMMSCTVEMVPLNAEFDVAVIDEIQMIGDEQRGWAWTQALLGLRAREIHLCGEERTVELIQELAASCGESVHIHRYTRLSPLKMAPESLRSKLSKLQKGDCIVSFSIMRLHQLRQAVERVTKRKCAIIYGSLPPETRAQQAALFNDPNNDYDYLVASNAVGMGLNLSIRRVIFESVHRFLGTKIQQLSVPEIKQIAGRAGRYSTASQDMAKSSSAATAGTAAESLGNLQAVAPSLPTGLVTTLEESDFEIVRSALDKTPDPLQTAGVLPPGFVVEQFARYFPENTPFSYILIRLAEVSNLYRTRFHMCDIRSQVGVADAIEPVRNMSVTDRLTFCAAPIEARREGEPELARAYARAVANCREVNILDFDEIDFSLLDNQNPVDRGYLQRLERLHKAVIIYMWLSFRFSGVFRDRYLTEHIKGLVEDRIEDALAKLSFNFNKMDDARRRTILDLLGEEATAREKAQVDKQIKSSGGKVPVGLMLDEMARQDRSFKKVRQQSQ